MARPRSKNNAVCQNKKCEYFRKIKNKDIIKKGKNYAKHQRFLCNHCGVVFVETKGTPIYRRRLDERKIKQLCKELLETKSIRGIERTIHVHRDTIGSYLGAFAEHAKEISDYLIKDVGLSAHEFDEFWTFVKKNKKKLSKTARRNLHQVTSGASQT
jgi:transposase-like protein